MAGSFVLYRCIVFSIELHLTSLTVLFLFGYIEVSWQKAMFLFLLLREILVFLKATVASK